MFPRGQMVASPIGGIAYQGTYLYIAFSFMLNGIPLYARPPHPKMMSSLPLLMMERTILYTTNQVELQ